MDCLVVYQIWQTSTLSSDDFVGSADEIRHGGATWQPTLAHIQPYCALKQFPVETFLPKGRRRTLETQLVTATSNIKLPPDPVVVPSERVPRFFPLKPRTRQLHNSRPATITRCILRWSSLASIKRSENQATDIMSPRSHLIHLSFILWAWSTVIGCINHVCTKSTNDRALIHLITAAVGTGNGGAGVPGARRWNRHEVQARMQEPARWSLRR